MTEDNSGSPTGEAGQGAHLQSLARALLAFLTSSNSQDTDPETPQSHLVHVCGSHKSQSDQDVANMHDDTLHSTRDRLGPNVPVASLEYALLLWALLLSPPSADHN